MVLTFGNMLFNITKGNELQNSVIEDHTAGSFQPAMYDGLDRNKAVRLVEQIALLGVRSDYLEIEMYVKTAGTDTHDLLTEAVFIEGVEYSGVPQDVQYAVFGQDSPFATPRYSIREGMLIGVDKQELAFTNNVEIAGSGAQNVPESQKIRGVVDDRVTVYGNAAAMSACTKFTMKLKPRGDNIFLLRAGCVIWLLNGTASKA